jgi:3-hydroxy acid dehydrogenase/malonic semialdehyde reductase
MIIGAMNITRLKDKWVLITGASSGFGAAAALSFAAQGSKLILGARRVDKLEAVAEAARKAGAPAAVVHALDVSKTPSVDAFATWVKTQTDKVDVLINNAGGAHGLDTVANGKDEDWEAMFQINVLGILRVTRAILPLMTNNSGSTIINIGSIAGRVAYEGGAAYCGSKAAELFITRALRLELSGTGVRVGTVDPGMAETEFSNVRFKGDDARAKKV